MSHCLHQGNWQLVLDNQQLRSCIRFIYNIWNHNITQQNRVSSKQTLICNLCTYIQTPLSKTLAPWLANFGGKEPMCSSVNRTEDLLWYKKKLQTAPAFSSFLCHPQETLFEKKQGVIQRLMSTSASATQLLSYLRS